MELSPIRIKRNKRVVNFQIKAQEVYLASSIDEARDNEGISNLSDTIDSIMYDSK